MFLEISQNSQENTCARGSACNFIKKETLAQLFTSEFFTEYLWSTASKNIHEQLSPDLQRDSFLNIVWQVFGIILGKLSLKRRNFGASPFLF